MGVGFHAVQFLDTLSGGPGAPHLPVNAQSSRAGDRPGCPEQWLLGVGPRTAAQPCTHPVPATKAPLGTEARPATQHQQQKCVRVPGWPPQSTKSRGLGTTQIYSPVVLEAASPNAVITGLKSGCEQGRATPHPPEAPTRLVRGSRPAFLAAGRVPLVSASAFTWPPRSVRSPLRCLRGTCLGTPGPP